MNTPKICWVASTQLWVK